MRDALLVWLILVFLESLFHLNSPTQLFSRSEIAMQRLQDKVSIYEAVHASMHQCKHHAGRTALEEKCARLPEFNTSMDLLGVTSV